MANSQASQASQAGQLGLGDMLDRGDDANEMGASLPSVDLGTGWTVVEVAAGGGHTCARLEDGAVRAVKCWGLNNHGQLGLEDMNNRGDEDGEMGDSLPAVDLGTGRSAVALALGDLFSCALLDDETVKCWGYNIGRLGLGDKFDRGDAGGEMGDSLPEVPLCLALCLAGYTGPAGGPCVACANGTYAATAKAWPYAEWAESGSCAACPSHSSSAAGSDELADCACDAGYTGPNGEACTACSDCDSVVTFIAMLSMSDAEFIAEKQDAYVAGVAQALSVTPSRVAIESITEQSSRRRLLAASIAVSTRVTVALTPSPPCRACRVLPCSLASGIERRQTEYAGG